MHVSTSSALITRCNQMLIQGSQQTMSAEGTQSLLRAYERYVEDHQVPLIFTVSSKENPRELCFVGMVTLKEGWIPQRQKHLNALRRTGCQVICFQPTDARLPKFPEEEMGGRRVRREDFRERKLPVTEGFGRFYYYVGMEEEDIRALIRLAHTKGKSVWLLGMGDSILNLSQEADGVISYGLILPDTARQGDGGEILAVDTPGQGSGKVCSYAIKDRADLLIPRPSLGRGGLASLSYALERAGSICEGMTLFWRYLIWMQWIRMLVLGLPMLTGQIVLDARHILLLSFVMDAWAFVCVALRVGNRRVLPTENGFRLRLRDFFGDRPSLLSASLAAVSVLLLPEWIGLLGWMGRFLYKTEFFLSALLFLHVTVLLCTCYRGIKVRLDMLLRNRCLIIAVGFVVSFLLLCAVWEPFGVLFAFEKNPVPFLLLSLIPSLLYLCLDRLFQMKCK